MTDIDKKNISPAKEGQDFSPAWPCNSAPKEASAGEKRFNGIVYKGINFWANLLVSIGFSDYFQHGPGRDQLDSLIRRTAKGVDAAGIMKGPRAYKQTKVAVETATMLSGGWLLLIPMKMMEDHKRPIVHWLNKKAGIAQTDETGRELGADEIYIKEEQPKQSWGRVIARRMLATVSVIFVGNALEHYGADKTQTRPLKYHFKGKHYEEQVHYGGKDRVTNTVVNGFNSGMRAVTGSKEFGTNPNAFSQRWLNFAVLDTVLTALTAGIMYVTKGTQKQEMPKEVTPCNDRPDAPLVSNTGHRQDSRFTSRIKPQEKLGLQDELTHVGRMSRSQELSLQQGI